MFIATKTLPLLGGRTVRTIVGFVVGFALKTE
jgi:hypothetical protein